MGEYEAVIEWRDPKALTPYELNNKRHPKEKIERLATLIKEYGFDQPITVTAEGEVIKGQARRSAALLLELSRVPVVVRADLSPAQIIAARIADNQAAEGSDYDYEAIAIDLEQLDSLNFDLELTGLDDWSDLLSSTDIIEPTDPNIKEAQRLLGNKAKQIKPVLYLPQVRVFEEALRLTGEMNRSEAFTLVCQFYLDHHAAVTEAKGQKAPTERQFNSL